MIILNREPQEIKVVSVAKSGLSKIVHQSSRSSIAETSRTSWVCAISWINSKTHGFPSHAYIVFPSVTRRIKESMSDRRHTANASQLVYDKIRTSLARNIFFMDRIISFSESIEICPSGTFATRFSNSSYNSIAARFFAWSGVTVAPNYLIANANARIW